jgi:NAD(P)H-dependent FMN reductase
MKILAISGSPRAASNNTAILDAIKRLAHPDVRVELFDGIGKLPFFNSDLEAERLPDEVAAFRHLNDAESIAANPEFAGLLRGALERFRHHVAAVQLAPCGSAAYEQSCV